MKHTMYILMKDYSIIRRTVKNPSDKFELIYKIDGENESFSYNFDRTKVYSMKKFIGRARISFYECGTMEPLDPKFISDIQAIKALNDIGSSKLIKELIASSKNKGMEMSMTMVLGLAGILALVLVVIFG